MKEKIEKWTFLYWDEPITVELKLLDEPIDEPIDDKINIKTKKMIQQVIPVGKKLLIKQNKANAYFKNTNIIIPEASQKNENKGTVIAVGVGITEIEIGDVIQYSEHCLPTTMMHNDEEHLLIHEGDVFAKFKYV